MVRIIIARALISNTVSQLAQQAQEAKLTFNVIAQQLQSSPDQRSRHPDSSYNRFLLLSTNYIHSNVLL